MLLSRLKAVQGEFDFHQELPPSEHSPHERSHQEENLLYTHHTDSPRILTREGLGRHINRTVPSTERTRTDPLRRPNNPSLRINNGVSPFRLGDVNWERDEVADSTYGPPSNEEYFVEGESKRAYVERTIPTSMTTDIPLRFHAGRESLSVKRNITVRELKRPKERAQDRDYKQRYSISPGQKIGGFVLETRENVNPPDRERGTYTMNSMSHSSILQVAIDLVGHRSCIPNILHPHNQHLELGVVQGLKTIWITLPSRWTSMENKLNTEFGKICKSLSYSKMLLVFMVSPHHYHPLS